MGGTGGMVAPCPGGGSAPIMVQITAASSLDLPNNRTALDAQIVSPNSSTFTYAWSVMGGPSGSKLYFADQAHAMLVGLKEGSYDVKLEAVDGCGVKGTATTTLTVQKAKPLPNTSQGQIDWMPAPVFAASTTLPPLTYTSCTFSLDEQFAFETALVEKYHYAYDLHRAEAYWNGLIDKPGTDVYKKIQKNKDDPKKYQLFASVVRPLWSAEEGRPLPYGEYLSMDLPSRCNGCMNSLVTADSVIPGSVHFSPAADPKYYDLIGDDTAQYLKPYRDKQIPLAVVLNLAEDGVGISQGTCHNHHWDTDPVIVADMKSVLGVGTVPPCSDGAWAVYVSKRIASLQQRITDKVVAQLSPETLYLRYRVEGNLNRERYGSWYDWAPFYEDTWKNSTLPNGSLYYSGSEPPYPIWDGSAGDPNTDMLTGTLAAVAWQIKAGAPLAYNWMSGGWTTAYKGQISSLDRYMGYLKAVYLTGNIGGVATWWTSGLFDDTCNPNKVLNDPSKVPPGLEQMIALGEVHALFSHYEAFLRDGTLLPGPALHRFSKGKPADKQVPAYEFVCPGGTCDRRLRVLVRKHATNSEWLIVAWATSGADTETTITVPELGEVTVNARAGGSLYHAKLNAGSAALELIDVDPLHPTDLLIP